MTNCWLHFNKLIFVRVVISSSHSFNFVQFFSNSRLPNDFLVSLWFHCWGKSFSIWESSCLFFVTLTSNWVTNRNFTEFCIVLPYFWGQLWCQSCVIKNHEEELDGLDRKITIYYLQNLALWYFMVPNYVQPTIFFLGFSVTVVETFVMLMWHNISHEVLYILTLGTSLHFLEHFWTLEPIDNDIWNCNRCVWWRQTKKKMIK